MALAATDAVPALTRFVTELGGTVLSGGESVGFRPVQVRVGDASRGMTVELLEPWDTARNDFLARFLAGHGDGPHHLTFKVDDFDAALGRVAATGRTPVGVNRADPNWMEAFLLPREACGTVVQLAARSRRRPGLPGPVRRRASRRPDRELGVVAAAPGPGRRGGGAGAGGGPGTVPRRGPGPLRRPARRRRGPDRPGRVRPGLAGGWPSASRGGPARARGSTASSWPATPRSGSWPGPGWSGS